MAELTLGTLSPSRDWGLAGLAVGERGGQGGQGGQGVGWVYVIVESLRVP